MSAGGAPSSDTPIAVSGGSVTGVALPSNSAALLVLSR
jgi:hypothetical protein